MYMFLAPVHPWSIRCTYGPVQFVLGDFFVSFPCHSVYTNPVSSRGNYFSFCWLSKTLKISLVSFGSLFVVFVIFSVMFVTIVILVYHTYLYNFCPVCGRQLSTIQQKQ